MIGICVIYLCADEAGEFLAQKSIEQIKKHTWGEYRIYGYAPRASESFLKTLKRSGIIYLPEREVAEEVKKLQSEEPTKQQMKEHSFLLNKLVSHAFEDGCDFAAAFDMDSWPAMSGWDLFYSRMLSDQTPVAGIVRTELNDNFPHGAFILLAKSFWKPESSSFCADQTRSLSRRPGETGGGILDQLANERKTLLRLERTNQWNLHRVMAGLYDDAIFHFGAGSRNPRFITDVEQYGLNNAPMHREFADDMNAAIRKHILIALRDNYDEFIRQLAGGDLAAFEPIPTEAWCIPPQLEHTVRSARSSCPPPTNPFPRTPEIATPSAGLSLEISRIRKLRHAILRRLNKFRFFRRLLAFYRAR
jgi:hypothetical protein